MSTLTAIAEDILLNAKRLDAFSTSRGLPSTSFDVDTLDNLLEDLEDARKSLVDSTQTLKQLALRPLGNNLELIFGTTDIAPLLVIYRYKIPQHVSLTDPISFVDLATAIGLSLDCTRRFPQYAMSKHLFHEHPPGHVSHTASSRLFVTEPDSFDHLGVLLEESGPAYANVVKAMELKGWEEQGPVQTGVQIGHVTKGLCSEEVRGDAEWKRRFLEAMNYITREWGSDVKFMKETFDWEGLGEMGVVVHAGAGDGTVAEALVEAFPNLKAVIQGSSGDIEQAKTSISAGLQESGRVRCMAHNYFTPQPFREADIYLFCKIFQNWSDRYCIKILSNLMPAMKVGSKILLYQYVLSDVAETFWSIERQWGMFLMAGRNGKERSERDWRELFNKAFGRLRFEGIKRGKPGQPCLIEATYVGRT